MSFRLSDGSSESILQLRDRPLKIVQVQVFHFGRGQQLEMKSCSTEKALSEMRRKKWRAPRFDARSVLRS
jgi:hypothetical protein